MAGMGRYPKDDASRRNRNERAFDWTVLPLEGRPGPAPQLPPLRPWTDTTHEWWTLLWATPQAVMWDPTGRTLHTLAILHHQLVIDQTLDADKSRAASVAAEMRQHEDRHGLTPKAMLQLRWKVSSSPSDGSGKVLQLVPREVRDRVADGVPDPARVPAKRATKGVWVEWAVELGMERSTADKLSKAKLIEEFSSPSASRPAERPPASRPVSQAAERLRAAHAANEKAQRPVKGRGRKR
jgi:hypothetical protein